MGWSGETREIGILLYPGAQLAAVHGLTDLFAIASRFSLEAAGDGAAPLSIAHWHAAQGSIGCVYRSEPAAAARPTVLVLPPTLADLPDPQTSIAISQWLRARHAEGVKLVSICSGVFLVAETGLLDGRVVSTHRSCAEALKTSFPRVGVDADARMIEHPGILTAGGFMAWVDVALLLIGRLLGDAVRSETARFALAGRDVLAEQGGDTGFAPRLAHGDAAVWRAQEFVHLRDGEGVLLSAMAAVAGLERRTFLRRFASGTGMTPIQYCRAVRLARARELLEAGAMPMKQIAESLGYADVSAFAKAFRRAYGTPPGAHRRQRGAAAGMDAAADA